MVENNQSHESSPILACEEASVGAMEGGPRHEIIGGTGRESRETTVFHAFERRAAERTSGQRRLGGGKRELVVAFVAVSIDSSVKAVRERE